MTPVPPPVTGSAPILEYSIWVVDTSNGSSMTVVVLANSSVGAVCAGLAPNRTYSVTVTAVSSAGAGGPSADVSVSTLVSSVDVPAVTNVVGTGVSSGTVVFAWDPVGVPGVSYILCVDAAGLNTTVHTSDHTAMVTGLTNGVPVYAVVAAVVSGTVASGSYRSRYPCFPGSAPPAPPGNISAVATIVNDTVCAVMSWSNVDGTAVGIKLQLFRQLPAGGGKSSGATGLVQSQELPGYTTSATMCGLEYGAMFYVSLQSWSCAGTGSAAVQELITNALPPPAPTNVSVSANATSITVHWSHYPGVSSHKVWACYCIGSGCRLPSDQVVYDADSATFHDVDMNVTYVFGVETFAGLLHSDMTQSPMAARGSTPPGSPEGVTSTALARDIIAVSWGPPVLDGGSPVIAYDVALMPADGLGRRTGAPIYRLTTTDTNAVFTNLPIGVTFAASVAAVSARGPGLPTESWGSVRTAASSPSPPRSLTATVLADDVSTASSALCADASHAAVLLEWDPPSDLGDGSSHAVADSVYFDVFAASSATTSTTPLAPTTPHTSATVCVPQNTSVSFVVAAWIPSTGLTSDVSVPTASTRYSMDAPSAPTIADVVADRGTPGTFYVTATKVVQSVTTITVRVYSVLDDGSTAALALITSTPCASDTCVVVVNGGSALPVNTTYAFVAIATNNMGPGQASLPVTQVQAVLPPQTPECAMTPRNASILVQCSATGSVGVTAYVLAVRPDDPSLPPTVLPPGPVTNASNASWSWVVEDLVNGVQTTVDVLAVGPTGYSSAGASSSGTVVPCDVPGVVGAPGVTAHINSMSASWQAAPTPRLCHVLYYIVTRTDSVTGVSDTVETTFTSHKWTNVTRGRVYRMVVSAVNAAGRSSLSPVSEGALPLLLPLVSLVVFAGTLLIATAAARSPPGLRYERHHRQMHAIVYGALGASNCALSVAAVCSAPNGLLALSLVGSIYSVVVPVIAAAVGRGQPLLSAPLCLKAGQAIPP